MHTFRAFPPVCAVPAEWCRTLHWRHEQPTEDLSNGFIVKCPEHATWCAEVLDNFGILVSTTLSLYSEFLHEILTRR